jgi:hypothetical protein
MANWRRGFFRLWILLAIIWVVTIGIIAAGPITHPHNSMLAFTYDKDDHIERLYVGTDRYAQVTGEYVNGRYQMVSFDSIAPNVTFYAQNLIVIEVGGKKYEMTFTNQSITDRPPLVASLTDYVLTLQPERSRDEITAEIETAVPAEVTSKFETQAVKDETVAYATSLYQTGLTEQRNNVLGLFAMLAFIPPLVVLLLGIGMAWALKGFLRQRPTSP